MKNYFTFFFQHILNKYLQNIFYNKNGFENIYVTVYVLKVGTL